MQNDTESSQNSSRGCSPIVLVLGILVTLFAMALIFVPYLLERRNIRIEDFISLSILPTETPEPTSTAVPTLTAVPTATVTSTITSTLKPASAFNFPALVPYVPIEGYLSPGQAQTFEFKGIFGVPLDFQIDAPESALYEVSIFNLSDTQSLQQQTTGPGSFRLSPLQTAGYRFTIENIEGEGSYSIIARFADSLGVEASEKDLALFPVDPVDKNIVPPLRFSWKPIPGALHQVVAKHLDSNQTFESEWLMDYTWGLDVSEDLLGDWEWFILTNTGARSGTARFSLVVETEESNATPAADDQSLIDDGKPSAFPDSSIAPTVSPETETPLATPPQPDEGTPDQQQSESLESTGLTGRKL